MLLIRACGISGEKQECDNIKNQAGLYGITVDDVTPKTENDIIDALHGGESYDYIYLSSHGNKSVFANDNSIIMEWTAFGLELCLADCLNEDCVIMLSCCRAGLVEIAYVMFFSCDRITFVVGPRMDMAAHEMMIGFNILLFNLEYRQVDPIIGCEKIKQGTDIRFVCYDRLETEGDYAYIAFTEKLPDPFAKKVEQANIANAQKGENTPESFKQEV